MGRKSLWRQYKKDLEIERKRGQPGLCYQQYVSNKLTVVDTREPAILSFRRLKRFTKYFIKQRIRLRKRKTIDIIGEKIGFPRYNTFIKLYDRDHRCNNRKYIKYSYRKFKQEFVKQ